MSIINSTKKNLIIKIIKLLGIIISLLITNNTTNIMNTINTTNATNAIHGNDNCEKKRIIYKYGLCCHFLELKFKKIIISNLSFFDYEISTDQPMDNQFKLNHHFQYVDDNMILSSNGKLIVKGKVAENIFSNSLIELIMTDDDLLDKICGFTDVQCYRSKLIESLVKMNEYVKV